MILTQAAGVSESEIRARSTAWAITYGDMVTLLLTFFVLLLIIMSEAEKYIDWEINELLNESYEKLNEQLGGYGYVGVERVTKGVKIIMASGRLFEPGIAEVNEVVYPVLRLIGGIIKLSPLINIENEPRHQGLIEAIHRQGKSLHVEIRCEGHTDDVPLIPGSKYRDNWDLSTARALNIVKLLSDFSDIPESDFSAMGYGQFRPVVDIEQVGKNPLDIADARAKNRRVEIYLDAFLSTNTITE